MSIQKQAEGPLRQLFKKFMVIYGDIEAIIILDVDCDLLFIEKRSDEFIKSTTGLINYLKPRVASLMEKGSSFLKYGIANMDSSMYRHLFINLREADKLLYLVLKKTASIDKIEPYGLFLAEKVSQILDARDIEDIQITMPSFNFESEMFEKYKVMIGFETGGIFRFKFCIIGDNAVGKTSCVRRFVENQFDRDYKSTIGLNIVSHSFNLLGNEINLVMWDLGGQQHYHRFRRNYYNGTQAIFIVFDLTRRESYTNAKDYWYEELKSQVEHKVPIVLIGNKCDLKKKRQVTYEEGQELADYLSEKEGTLVSYLETSAASGENVGEAFEMVTYQYIVQSREGETKELQDKLVALINSILDKKEDMTLAFFTDSLSWSPAVRILTEISDLGEYQLPKDEQNEIIYQYQNGLTIRNYDLQFRDVSDCDGVYCIFDAIGKTTIEPHWRDLLLQILKVIGEDTDLLIGIRVTEDQNWSQLISQFNLGDSEKMGNVSYHQLGNEYQLDVFENLQSMFNSINFFL